MADSQRARLAKPFPRSLIRSNPSGGGSYVKHSVVLEKLLAVLGPFTWECVQVIRGDVQGKPGDPKGTSARARAGTPDLHDVVVGCIWRLTTTIEDEDERRQVSVEEAGDCETPHNWDHDGARLKDATSDALKRCAMRLGVGLHLWSQDEFTLYEQLTQERTEAT